MPSHKLPLVAFVLLAASALLAAAAAEVPLQIANLAAKHPATASGSRGKNLPENAVDGDPKTVWTAPEAKAPAWWSVDLGAPQELGGCEITWEREILYGYALEGSLDGSTWTLLNDQRGNHDRLKLQRLVLAGTARYVRISATSIEGANPAGIAEVQLFAAADMKRLTPEQSRTFLRDEPFLENLALGKPIAASGSKLTGDKSPDPKSTPDKTVDGDPRTRWIAEEGNPAPWWSVDLGAVHELGGSAITWDRRAAYPFLLEGSLDNKNWFILNDQRGNDESSPLQRLAIPSLKARYVRLTAYKAGSSVAELELYDSAAMARLSSDTRKEYHADDPNIALLKPAICSSIEGKDRVAAMAVDGDPGTRWCASSLEKPQWLEVDLEQPHSLASVQIQWEHAKMAYRFVIEG
ncbi:MAG TPA: discoidin domain-containing protein, partial [Phycisphaerae bacterium]|nr:discoidin domain-containing protein [Phycisphaerae bacterium]